MKTRHIHKYKRIDMGRNRPYIVYRCQLPDCTHYTPPELVVGRLCVCWNCKDDFQLTYKLLRVTPICGKCRLAKKYSLLKEKGVEIPTSEDLDSVLKTYGLLDISEDREDREDKEVESAS